jgi:PTS system nitrogen regulatory IIA component
MTAFNKTPATANSMSLSNVLIQDRICMLSTDKKEAALSALIRVLATSPEVGDEDALTKAILERERLMSTGIGLGLAVPHVRLPSVTGVVMAVGISDRDITDYESLDGKPVRMLLMIAARQDQHAAYLRLLSLVSGRLKNEQFRTSLLETRDPAALYNMLISN